MTWLVHIQASLSDLPPLSGPVQTFYKNQMRRWNEAEALIFCCLTLRWETAAQSIFLPISLISDKNRDPRVLGVIHVSSSAVIIYI